MTDRVLFISNRMNDVEIVKKLVIGHKGKIVDFIIINSGETIIHFTYPAWNIIGMNKSHNNLVDSKE